VRGDICHSEGGLQGEGRMSGLGEEGGSTDHDVDG